MNESSSSRRAFLMQSAAMMGATLAAPIQAAPEPSPAAPIDTNVYLGAWPFRNFPWATDAEVISNLRKRGVRQAWAGSFEGILQRDLASVNARLSAACQKDAAFLLPVGSVNPMLPDWIDDVRRCATDHGMKLIRLHPNYHGYALSDPIFRQVLEAASAQKLAVQIVAQMEDQRTQHPLVKVKPVDFKPLAEVMKQAPAARVMVLNANATIITTALAGNENLWLDSAMIEGVGGLEPVAATKLGEKLCFGSYAPVFYWEAAQLKMQESILPEAQIPKIMQGNAASFLPA